MKLLRCVFMDIKTRYTNIGNETLTEKQALAAGEYFIETSINGKIKTEESYKNNIPVGLIYYTDADVDVADVVSRYSHLPHVIAIVREILARNDYKLFEHLCYKQGQLEAKIITVEDNSGHEILWQRLDMATGKPECTEKSYYENGREVYLFIYDGDSHLISVSDQNDSYGGLYSGASIKEFISDWTGLEYFKSAEPLIPE